MSDSPDLDRSVSQVAARRGRPWLDRRKLIICSVPFAGLILLVLFWRGVGSKPKEEVDPQISNHMAPLLPYIPPKLEPPVIPIVARPPTPPVPPPAPPFVVQNPGPVPAPGVPTPQAPPVKRPGFIAFAVPAIPEALQPKPITTANAGDAQKDTTHVIYKPTTFTGVKAGPMGDPTLKLKPGLLRCVMDNDINSDLPGPFQCHLPGDVMSERNVVLMEKGTVVTGSYDSKIATGQKRLMALTVVAYTPNDCMVPLGGPMADATGRTGLEGEVRNHTLEKFGFAFLLSGIDVASGLLQAAMQQNGGNNTYLSLNSGNGLTGLAQEILRENMNIKPTIEPHRGDDVMIWLPGPAPIDFSDCYKLVTRN